MRISDWSSDVCSSDLRVRHLVVGLGSGDGRTAMTVAAILAGKGHEVVTVTADHSVAEALAVLADRRIGAVPVMADDGVAGVFSERDVILCLAQIGRGSCRERVGQYG